MWTFFYNRGELEVDLNHEECTVHIEYDLKTSKEIVLFQDVEDNDKSITPFHFFNTDGTNQLAYSKYMYNSNELPEISGQLSQDNPDFTFTKGFESFNLNHIFECFSSK